MEGFTQERPEGLDDRVTARFWIMLLPRSKLLQQLQQAEDREDQEIQDLVEQEAMWMDFACQTSLSFIEKLSD